MADRGQKARQRGKGVVKPADQRRQGAGQASVVPKGSSTSQAQTLALGRRNLILLGSGIALVVIGFALLAAGDITFAPILLLAGYLGLIPMGLVAGSLSDDESEAQFSAEGKEIEE